MIAIHTLIALAIAVCLSGVTASLFGLDYQALDHGLAQVIGARDVTVTITETLCATTSYGSPPPAVSTAVGTSPSETLPTYGGTTVLTASSGSLTGTTPVSLTSPSTTTGTAGVPSTGYSGGGSEMSSPSSGSGTPPATPSTSSTPPAESTPTTISSVSTILSTSTHGTTTTPHSSASTTATPSIPPAVNAAGIPGVNSGIIALAVLAALF